jgi:hypothetical protein
VQQHGNRLRQSSDNTRDHRSAGGMSVRAERNLGYTTTNSIANSAATVLQGTLCFPTTYLTYSGASTTGMYTAIIAKRIRMAGSAAFKNDPTGTYTGLASTVRGLIQQTDQTAARMYRGATPAFTISQHSAVTFVQPLAMEYVPSKELISRGRGSVFLRNQAIFRVIA